MEWIIIFIKRANKIFFVDGLINESLIDRKGKDMNFNVSYFVGNNDTIPKYRKFSII